MAEIASDLAGHGAAVVSLSVRSPLPVGALRSANGRTEPYDAIIAATGFGTGLSSLISVHGVLNQHGEPLARFSEPTTQPGLFFIGYTHSLRGHLFKANRASRQLARHVARYLEHVPRRSSASALRCLR